MGLVIDDGPGAPMILDHRISERDTRESRGSVKTKNEVTPTPPEAEQLGKVLSPDFPDALAAGLKAEAQPDAVGEAPDLRAAEQFRIHSAMDRVGWDVGAYRKFTVERADGSSKPGGKHEHCEYFVLDWRHDPFAIPAARAYADACESEYPALADDLRKRADAAEHAAGAK